MYYYGTFRSLDQSVDPLGQEYKVVILTGWNGIDSPYPYKTIIVGRDVRPQVVPDPDKVVQLTMTDHPFIVTYSEDDLHSPHKLSTAEVSFLQNNFNLDFYDPTGKKCIVMLLKKNNNVVRDGSTYLNQETGARLYQQYIDTGQAMMTVGFVPEQVDAFCYTTEWIGFATPDVLNGEFSHIFDRFSLNAQDAYSSLKYMKYQYKGDVSDISSLLRNGKETILDLIASLGTYKKVYISNTIRFFGETKTALDSVNHQQWNWFDENNDADVTVLDPSSSLNVIDNLLNYFGLKAIPWKDSVIITTPEAIAGGFNSYYVYSRPITHTECVIAPPDSRVFNQETNNAYLTLGYDITGDDFNGPSMQISTDEVYNSTKLTVSEFPVDNLIPDFSDDHNITGVGEGIQLSNDFYFKTGTQKMYWYWEHECFWPHKENYIHGEDVELYYYEPDNYGPGWGQPQRENPTWFTFGQTLLRTPFACILDDGGFQVGTDKTEAECLAHPYNPSRKIFFNTPIGNGNRGDYGDYGNYRGGNRRFKYWQTMMRVRTKPFVAKRGMCMSLTGDWTFYASRVVNLLQQIPQQTKETTGTPVREAKIASNAGFFPMKIRCNDKYLYNSSSGFHWSSTECECQVFVELGSQQISDVLAFNNPLRFEHTFRNFENELVVPLPFDNDEEVKPMDIEIWFSRPIGVSSILCTCATLTNFDVKVYPQEYVTARKRGDSGDTDTEYKSSFDETVINENNNVDIMVSSDANKGLRYSMVVGGNATDGYNIIDRVSNIATSHSSLPEQGVVESIMAQYKKPNIILSDDYKRGELTPISKLRWPTQMGDKRFIPTSFEIDYEYENVNMDIREVAINETTPAVIRANRTRNLRRRGDIINSDFLLWREPSELVSSNNRIIDGFTCSLTKNQFTGHWTISSQTPEISGLTFQPVFEDCNMLVSIPDELDSDIQVYIKNDRLKIDAPINNRRIDSLQPING